MLIFLAIALASFLIIAGSFIFGHDHDHDAGPTEGHDLSHDVEPTISFFSVKVIATLTMGFGAAGAIARMYGADLLISSFWGLGSGVVLSVLMYLMLRLIYSQQASSLVQTSSVIGSTGVVTTSIETGGMGEVGVTVGNQYLTYMARSGSDKPIARGRSITVVNVVGSELIVQETRTL